MVELDPKTGLVRAMVGGRGFAQSQVNLALGGTCPVTAEKAPAESYPQPAAVAPASPRYSNASLNGHWSARWWRWAPGSWRG